MSERPDRTRPGTLSDSSLAVHGGIQLDSTLALRTPLVMANSYQLPDDPSEISWSANAPGLYTRNTGVNQQALQEKLAALDDGEDAVALASGVAALHAVFFTYVRAGDHVVVSDVTYEATWRLWSELLPQRYGIEATFVDITDHDAVRAAMRPNTRLVCVETIANPTTQVTDVAAIAAIAHEAGAILMVDSTYTPPPVYRPLRDGADLVVHSLSKYVNGHGDAMAGAVVGSRALIDPIKADAMIDVGGIISPFNAWQIQRGSVTLPMRMRQHSESAQAIAELLDADPRVAYVSYPGLPSHPQHELAVRQFGRSFSGMMSFAVDGDPDTQNRFVANLRLITSGFSLGHDDSLIVHTGTEGGRVAAYPEPFRRLGHLRLSVGLEDTADLLADLRAALDETFA
ncbi:trans-sulfuration enzyme family protein [Microbacterium azadirachtae]|uniref:trans-sulfuration enzyme family protein n=1 Tax=Microbacterium azadirachtae TaxID=582680 RepID=UPI00088DB83F|nr:aminotransferase class V-fold PLP-dependent enzyme [Microbacterium azadirachtae]UXW86425.1 aminotransferase class V-fold PLP-dependent enzyme [Microbacterium azadirachtae]SDL92277.1 methionine-gamma-lyase [Microbacterium azadirachtae]SEG15583.1 methionine-gamma-lyase [Microbacterium azadirachtae]SEG18194.1 methionine-gamma-lyase [Microbacterium azadirachtae]